MQNTFSQSGNDSKWFLIKIIFQNRYMALETPSRPPLPFMANAILNFHFDFLHPSLTGNLLCMSTQFHYFSFPYLSFFETNYRESNPWVREIPIIIWKLQLDHLQVQNDETFDDLKSSHDLTLHSCARSRINMWYWSSHALEMYRTLPDF